MDNLIGITFGDWFELAKENGFRIDGEMRGMATKLTLMSIIASQRKRLENRRFGDQVARMEIKEPLFIIGHWRSGTTLLHTLMAQDERFTFPKIYEVSNPHTFLLIGEDIFVRRAAQLAGTRKRPMDNVEFEPLSPAEDELGVASMCIRSPLIAWSFLSHEAFYDRYLTFRQAPPEDYERWRQAFIWFLKKVTFKNDRPLLLKSPPHTARIRLILELFPDARFVHIHRNPYAVFRSTMALYTKGIIPNTFQAPSSLDQVVEGILKRYDDMYTAFFEERYLIPPGQYTEVAFETLEQNKMSEVARIYEALRLPGFDRLEPTLRSYVDSLATYQKNVPESLPEDTRRRIAKAWQRNFDEWGYAV